MKQQLDRMEQKLDKLDSRMDKVDVRLAKYNAELEFHVARTNQIEDDLLPIARHVTQINAVFKFATWVVGTVLAITAMVWGIK